MATAAARSCTREWNLGYRIAADAHGHGYATELARAAIRQSHQSNPDLPVVAYLLEHNVASERVARKVGMQLVHRGPDAGNPDPSAVRLVYAERALSPEELTAATSYVRSRGRRSTSALRRSPQR